MKTTQNELAYLASIKPSYLSELLNGKKKNPSRDVALRLGEACQYLNLPFTSEDWALRAFSIKAELDKIRKTTLKHPLLVKYYHKKKKNNNKK